MALKKGKGGETLPYGTAVAGVAPGCGLLAQFYSAVLGSVDWQRDVRRRITVCRDALGIAKLALEVFNGDDAGVTK